MNALWESRRNHDPDRISGAEKEQQKLYKQATEYELKEDKDEFFVIHSTCLLALCRNIFCTECLESNLRLSVNERKGLSAKFTLYCSSCQRIDEETWTSPRLPQKNGSNREQCFAVNKKTVEATNSIGVGVAAHQKFCSDININPMSKATYHKYLKMITDEAVEVQKKILSEASQAIKQYFARKDAQTQQRNQRVKKDVAVRYDGTWLTRGHSSLIGVGIVIEMETGLVIDFEVLSKYCQMCTTTAAELDPSSPDFNLWYQDHVKSGECNINYQGSSGGMEGQAAVNMFSRSEEQFDLRYVKVNSDGDARTHKKLNEIQPYGPLVFIDKEECINHVSKRMGKGLRELATKEKLGGKKAGAWTAKKIGMLSKYYGKAIRNNLPDVAAMKKAILATLSHCSSTDEKPNHSLCPDGPDSWCFFNSAIALKRKPKSHTKMAVKLSHDVADKMKPLYTRLSDDELLKRCTMGETQNANESLHAQIWRRCPKEVFVSKKRVHTAVVNAVMEHNYGIIESVQIRNSTRGEEMSDVAIKVGTRRENARSKRKQYQDDYRQSKRARKCAQQYEGLRGRTRASSEDYCSGKF